MAEAATISCTGCDETIGAGDVLVRAFSGNELVPVCAACAPEELEYFEAEPCCGCARLVRYERSQHSRIHHSCDEKCRLLGVSQRRLETAARARRKHCAHCGTAFTAQRKDARFCGDPCRKQSHYASRGGATLATGDFESWTSGR